MSLKQLVLEAKLGRNMATHSFIANDPWGSLSQAAVRVNSITLVEYHLEIKIRCKQEYCLQEHSKVARL